MAKVPKPDLWPKLRSFEMEGSAGLDLTDQITKQFLGPSLTSLDISFPFNSEYAGHNLKTTSITFWELFTQLRLLESLTLVNRFFKGNLLEGRPTLKPHENLSKIKIEGGMDFIGSCISIVDRRICCPEDHGLTTSCLALGCSDSGAQMVVLARKGL